MTKGTAAWRIAAAALCLAVAIAAGPRAALSAAGDAATPAAGTAAAGPAPVMIDARAIGDDGRTRFIADLTGQVDIGVFTLADPYRVVIDFPETHFSLPADIGGTGRGLVSAFRYGEISPGKSRIVLDVTKPVKIDKAFVIPQAGTQPARIVVDMVPSTREAFIAASKLYRDADPPAAPPKQDRASTAAGKLVVVLDPGHGGIDAGTRGVHGTLEKDVTLAFAKVLGAKLEATGRYQVLYTRSDDTFVALGDRVDFARANNADLFISIHANSFAGASVRGATVYTVSDEASDKMAADLAASENQSDILAGVTVKGADSDQVKDILLDLTRRETRNFGVVFARNLVKELGTNIAMFKVPHQTAAFRVLEAPDVPSALIELGYLSNPSDEKLLGSDNWQDGAADSVLRAVAGYFQSRLTARGTP
jgi:N-acetylmuramoyl-L-alanine amidase